MNVMLLFDMEIEKLFNLKETYIDNTNNWNYELMLCEI
jgi:hypothetical protein